MKTSALSKSAALAAAGHFFGTMVGKPIPFTIFSSQILGQALEFMRTGGDLEQLKSFRYTAGTLATMLLGEILKNTGSVSSNVAYLMAALSLIAGDLLLENVLVPQAPQLRR